MSVFIQLFIVYSSIRLSLLLLLKALDNLLNLFVKFFH